MRQADLLATGPAYLSCEKFSVKTVPIRTQRRFEPVFTTPRGTPPLPGRIPERPWQRGRWWCFTQQRQYNLSKRIPRLDKLTAQHAIRAHYVCQRD